MGTDKYYHIFRTLKQTAAQVYNPPRLQEAEDLEDVALLIRHSFDAANQQAVAKSLHLEVEIFLTMLELIAAAARIERQVLKGGW